MKKRFTVDPEQRSLEFMRQPQLWPAWPFLPLKRSLDRRPFYGVLVESSGEVKPTVLVRNLFDTTTPLCQSPRVEYDSLEALVADGWLVD